MTLDISLDKFDAYLLDYNSIFGDGSGLLTLEDILRCTISRLSYEVPEDNFLCVCSTKGIFFGEMSAVLSQIGLQISDILAQFDAQKGCRPRTLCSGDADGRSTLDEYFSAVYNPMSETVAPPWLFQQIKSKLSTYIEPSFLMVQIPKLILRLVLKSISVSLMILLNLTTGTPPSNCPYDSGFSCYEF